MNDLDSTHSVNTTQNVINPSESQENQDTLKDAANLHHDDTAENNTISKEADIKIKKVRKNTIVLSLVGALTIAVAGVLIYVFFHNVPDEEFDENFDLKETVFVTDSDSPRIDQISENVLGTGMLFEDCDVLTRPEEGSEVEGRLSGGTDVLIYSAEGDYYKVSDPNNSIIGYVLKEKVNTGNIDLGNPDAASEIVDDTTGKVVGKESTKPIVATSTVNPEDFPVNSSPYFIYVEKGSHTITIFGKDQNGKYTVPRKTFLTATGRTASLTPVGNFTIKGKEKWHSWGNCYSPYCCKYYGSLFFHGPLYKQKNFGTLMTGSVSQIGTNASSGCMRTSVQAAYFIYQFCWVGTNVKIVNGSPLNRSAGRPTIASQYVDPATNLVPAAGIAFGFDSKTMYVGDSLIVSVDFEPAMASEKDCSWSSTNSGIVSVSGNGENCTLKAIQAGSAVITACSIDGGYTASFTVKVLSNDSSDESSDVSNLESDDISSNESEPSSDENSSSNETSSQDNSTTETSSQDSSTTETSALSSTPDDSPVNE